MKKPKKFKIVFLIILLLLIVVIYRMRPNLELNLDTYDKINPIVFRMAETMSKEHPSAQATEYFANLVREKSEGRINIKVYYEGSLGTPKEILEQVQFGGIAMARVNALELTEVVSSLQYYFKPQLYENTDDLMTWIWNNQEGISDSCQMERMTPLVWYYPDVRCFYSDSVSFEDVDDFQGKRIETTPVKIMKDIMDKLGAEAVESQTAETYKSLSTGYMDAGETTLSEFVLSDYYRFINFVTISEYIASPDVIVVSTVAFTSLDKKDRELIEACAQETYEYQKALLETFQKNWIPILKADKDLFLENATFKEKIDLLLRKYMGEEV